MKAALLAAALVVHGVLLYPYVASGDYQFDAVHTYLPYASRLLAEGWAFFLAPESGQVTPLSYLYPALLGARLETLKHANYVLSFATLLLAWRSASLAHSPAAGLATAWLIALCPLLRPYLAAPLTEAPYLFLLAAWIWAVAEWYDCGRARYALIAGVAMGLAILTRATFLYGVIAFTLVLAARREKTLAAAHVIALLLPAAFILKNALLFSFPQLATGAGNALYLGSNPVTGGFEPPYLGLLYDVGTIIRAPSHLTFEADRLLGGVGRMLVADTGPLELARMYAVKLRAFVFVTNAEGHALELRAWRIGLIVFACAGLAQARLRPLRWILAACLAYQVAVHVPSLYSHRYSVGALDLWLAILAGVGIAASLQRSRGLAAALAGVAALGIAAGAAAYTYGGLPEPDVFLAQHELMWEARDVRGAGVIDLEVRDAPKMHPWSNYVLVIDAARPCEALRLSYRRKGQAQFGPAIVRSLARPRHQFGAIDPLGVSSEGTLRLESGCAMQLGRVAIYAANGALEFGERYVRITRMAPGHPP